MLNAKAYTQAIDMWAVGCILAEMLSRRPLFPGTDYQNQLELILRVIGTPCGPELGVIRSDAARRYVERLPHYARVELATLFPAAHPLALDLLQAMFQFDPDRRITAAAALEHEYVIGYHDPALEPVAQAPFEFEFELDDLPVADVKHHLVAEGRLFAV